MSAHTLDKLVYMANQIATNLALEGDPVGMVADHIHAFWDPRMKAMILANGAAGLNPIAAQAIARLAVGAYAT
jgi:hypothetical protein